MKKETESQIQAQIVEYLTLRGIFCHSVPNEGAGKDKLRTMRMITMGLRPGVADLVVWFPWGRIGYLEIKVPGGRQSEKQKKFQKRCEREGVLYAIVTSVEDVEEILKQRHWREHGK